MLTFKQFIRVSVFLLLLPVGCSGGANNPSHLKSTGYNIRTADNSLSKKWGEYLYKHLSRRSKEKDMVFWQETGNNLMTIDFEVDNALKHDYYIKCQPKHLTLKAKDENVALWLIYQLMSQMANHNDWLIADDLPPAILSFHDRYMDLDFDYREPYFSPNQQSEYARILGTNLVEEDWAIWGHNLKQALGGNKKVYTKQTSWKDIEAVQYCFSNGEIYKELKRYIDNNFGDGKENPRRFMIMPNDNDIVCTCDQCISNGNTPDNATPAVTKLIKQIAGHFPHHMFFTTAYLTTKQPPKEKLPHNTGVMISTIDLPKGVAFNGQKEVKEFLSTLDKWKSCTSNIYIWDYAANFDDYLTPLPVLIGLKEQLSFFKSKGVNGIFLNANGYDYSPFDDMKTFVAASLMTETTLPVDSLCCLYFDRFYPTGGKVLGDYYLSLEKTMQERKKPYDIYGGFDKTMKTYLDIDAFVKFYNSLKHLISTTEGEEQERLKKLFTALSFTRLQVAYYQKTNKHGFATINGNRLSVKPEIKAIYDNLSQYTKYKDLLNYKEVGGSLKLYLSNWDRIYKENPFENLLMNKPLKVLSRLDEDYRHIEVLNDGIRGFGEEYHQGWHLCSTDDLLVRFDTDGLKKATKIQLRFLVDEKHHIYLPDKVELYKNEVVYKDIALTKEEKFGFTSIVTYSGDVDISDAGSVDIKVYRKAGGKSSLACDEIQLN